MGEKGSRRESRAPPIQSLFHHPPWHTSLRSCRIHKLCRMQFELHLIRTGPLLNIAEIQPGSSGAMRDSWPPVQGCFYHVVLLLNQGHYGQLPFSPRSFQAFSYLQDGCLLLSCKAGIQSSFLVALGFWIQFLGNVRLPSCLTISFHDP